MNAAAQLISSRAEIADLQGFLRVSDGIRTRDRRDHTRATESLRVPSWL
jgi:hypothetical protein